ALGRLGVLVRGWDLLPAGGPAESDQGTERQRPAPRPPRPRHAHARRLTRIATTTPATYHRHPRWAILSQSDRRGRRATACAVRRATTRTRGTARRSPRTDPRCCRRR